MTDARNTVEAATALTLPALADLMTRGFEGYFVPVVFTADKLTRHLREEDVDLELSLVACVDNDPAALALVARRGDRARVAAMGVATPHRRSGLGRILVRRIVEDHVARNGGSLVLEVITDNTAARRLYLSEGFRERRTLVGWERPSTAEATPPGPLQPASFEEIASVLRADGPGDLPWQLAAETVAARNAPVEAWRLGEDAFAVVNEATTERVKLGPLIVRAGARRRGSGRAMVRALAAHYPGADLFFPPILPEGHCEEFLRAVGFNLSAMTQQEMEWEG